MNKVKMDQKGRTKEPKRPNMYEKDKKIEFSDLKNCFLAEISLAELGGTPLPP